MTPPAISAALAQQPVSAESWRAFAEYLKQRAAAGEFSGVVLAVRNGKPLLLQGYGMADKQLGIANTPQTKFEIASMGKMFTGVAIAQLVERHKLSFNDTIGNYVSGFPPEIANKVTVHELLTHTAGMGNVALARRPDSPEPPHTIAGMMERIVKAPLQFEPGSRMSYSNDGFIVAGAIIERITGQSYADYVREHIFEPAGMADTDIRVYKPSEIPNMAHAYALVGENGQPLGRGPGQGPTPQSGTLVENDETRIGNPSGGEYSTVGDMLKFAQALARHKLLGPKLTETVMTGKVNSTRQGPGEDKYAYGFADTRINGVRIVGHDGGSPGYEAQLDIYPDRGYIVVMLTNQDDVLRPALQRSQDMLTH